MTPLKSLFPICTRPSTTPQGLAIGDINSDMKPDVAVAGGGGLAVIRQEYGELSVQLSREGFTYSDRGLDQGFPLSPFGWSGTRGPYA
jgi:hypothetical protein